MLFRHSLDSRVYCASVTRCNKLQRVMKGAYFMTDLWRFLLGMGV